jgi:hypothetical protein
MRTHSCTCAAKFPSIHASASRTAGALATRGDQSVG